MLMNINMYSNIKLPRIIVKHCLIKLTTSNCKKIFDSKRERMVQSKLVVIWILMTTLIIVRGRNDNDYSDVHWKQANLKCEKLGSHLAVIHSVEDDKKVFEYCAHELTVPCWIGVKAPSCKHSDTQWTHLYDGTWQWVDGIIFYKNDTTVYQNWCKDYPRKGVTNPAAGVCDGGVHVLYDVEEKCWKNYWDGHWSIEDVKSNYFRKYVCQHHIDDSYDMNEIRWYEGYWGYITLSCLLTIFCGCNLVLFAKMRKHQTRDRDVELSLTNTPTMQTNDTEMETSSQSHLSSYLQSVAIVIDKPIKDQ